MRIPQRETILDFQGERYLITFINFKLGNLPALKVISYFPFVQIDTF